MGGAAQAQGLGPGTWQPGSRVERCRPAPLRAQPVPRPWPCFSVHLSALVCSPAPCPGGQLGQQTLSRCLRAGSPRSRCWQGWCLLRPLSLAADRLPSRRVLGWPSRLQVTPGVSVFTSVLLPRHLPQGWARSSAHPRVSQPGSLLEIGAGSLLMSPRPEEGVEGP